MIYYNIQSGIKQEKMRSGCQYFNHTKKNDFSCLPPKEMFHIHNTNHEDSLLHSLTPQSNGAVSERLPIPEAGAFDGIS